MSQTLNVGYAASSLILLTFFVAALALQLSAKTCRPLLYWAVIVATSTAGTTVSDYMDRSLALGYAEVSLILVTLLLAIFAVWRFSTGSVSVDNIKTKRVELFYWTTILFSNTLSMALGDYLADSSGLGFVGGAALSGGLLALLVAAHFLTKLSGVLLFWVAFVLTRPFGATFGDLLTKPSSKRGLDLGTAGSSMVLASALAILVIHAMVIAAHTRQYANLVK